MGKLCYVYEVVYGICIGKGWGVVFLCFFLCLELWVCFCCVVLVFCFLLLFLW